MNFEGYIGKPDKQRLINAMRLQEVDRVPYYESLIEDKHVEKMLGRYAGNTLSFGGEMAKGQTENLRPMLASDYVEICNIIGQDVITAIDLWTPFKKESKDGKFIPAFDKSVRNLTDFKKLRMPDYENIDKNCRYIREYKEAVKGTRIGVAAGGCALMQTLYEFVVGFSDFMIASSEDLNFIEEMLEISSDYWYRYSKAIIAEGIDIFVVGDDIAFKNGLFIQPEIIKKIWLPRIAKIISPAVEAGIPVQFHSDGKVDDIVQELINIGVNCLNPMDPYCVDYRQYKKKYGNRIALSGNIDIQFPLATGTPEDVEKDVKEHMEILKPGYGYVCCSSHSIVNYIPYDNFVALVNSIHKYGKY